MTPGIRVRSLMLFVAAVAGCIAMADYLARDKFTRSEYRSSAQYHGAGAQSAEAGAKKADIKVLKEWLARKSRYHREMEGKYRQAASRPFWQGIPPSPRMSPEPAMPNIGMDPID